MYNLHVKIYCIKESFPETTSSDFIKYVERQQLEQVITAVCQKYVGHSINGEFFLIQGGLVDIEMG